jgi:predicted nucleotidyltransferase
MSHDIIFKMAIKRREVFQNLEKYLKVICEVSRKIDEESKVYLFGSVVENRNTYSSDIDVLIVTRKDPAKFHLELWRAGIGEPFEIHIQPPERMGLYSSKLKRIQ